MDNYMTLCLRIQFDGPSGQMVLETDINPLLPWLRNILTNLGLPHPKQANVLKPPTYNRTSDIDMYWDVVSKNPIIRNICVRCENAPTTSLREKFIVRLMVFFLPYNVRGIPSGLLPTVMKQSLDETTATVVPTIASTSGPDSHSQPSSLEARLHTVLRSAGAGISLPLQHQDLAYYIPMLENYIESLRSIAERETARRMEAEANLAEEEARHARILLGIKEECREPFVVPALLDAFVSLSETVDNFAVSGMNR